MTIASLFSTADSADNQKAFFEAVEANVRSAPKRQGPFFDEADQGILVAE
jgi:hypothetical protein